MSLLSKFFLVISLTTISFSAQAQWGGFIGLNTSEYSGSGNWDRDFGVELGAAYILPLSSSFFFRSGLGLVQKNSEKGSTTVKFMYAEVPLTIMFQAGATTAIFTGFNLNMKVSSSPSPLDSGDETFVVNLPIGVRFGMGGPHNIEGILDLGITDMAGNTAAHSSYKLGNSLAARYVYMF